MDILNDIIVMGAGPAGLAAGYELKKNGCRDIRLFESEGQVGGISKTIQYKGYYFDLGGHRFFTKLNNVNKLWNEVQDEDFNKVSRLSRIYYKNKYFNYPLKPVNALTSMGLKETVEIIYSYIYSRLFPYKNEDTFEEWVSNRFGKKLYTMFFRSYTEKVWGIPCSKIQAEWAAQRIKGLSLKTALMNAIFSKKNNVKTLINEFYYPSHGPGMMYGSMKNKIEEMGGRIYLNSKIVTVHRKKNRIVSVDYLDKNGVKQTAFGKEFISSIPVTELVQIMYPAVDPHILEAAAKLKYRSIITVDVIVDREELFPDNWLYIHSPDVKLGRIQNFKNWSIKMIPEKCKTSLGLEYFCNENDELWNKNDEEIFELAANEIEKINICSKVEIEDYIVVRVPKAYPVYMRGYRNNINIIESYLRGFENLQLIGRYGLFKYNNMDHSILTGIYAANNILEDKYVYDTWKVNTGSEYLEEKRTGYN